MQGHPGGVQGVCPGPPGGSAQPAGADRHGDPGGYRPRPGQYKDLHNQRELTAMETLEDTDLAQVSIRTIMPCLVGNIRTVVTLNRTRYRYLPGTIGTMLVWAAISWY